MNSKILELLFDLENANVMTELIFLVITHDFFAVRSQRKHF